MLKYYFTILLFFTNFLLFAQQNEKDSLLAFIEKKQINCPDPCFNDTNKINALNHLVLLLMYSEPEKTLEFSKKALALSENLNWKKGIGDSYHSLGVYYYTQSDFQKTINFWLRALKVREEIGSKGQIATSIGNIGLIYQELNNFPKALEYFIKALKTDEEIGNKEGVSRHLCNLGVLYSEQKSFNKSNEYYLKALKLSEETGNDNNVCVITNNIGLNYNEQGLYAKALEYFFKAINKCKEIENKSAIAAALGNIGIAYEQQGEYNKALNNYFKSLEINRELGRKNGLILQYGNIGSLYTSIGNFKEAEIYLKKSLSLADSIDSKDDKKTANYNLSRLFDTIGNHKKALEYYKRFIEVRDEMYNEEREEKLMHMEATYEFNKKTAVMEAQQEKERAISETERKKQNTIIWIVAAGLLLMAFFAFNTFRKNNTITKQKQIVEKKNEIIEEKQREITESINYAKRIQQAILPPINNLKEFFNESFVLYQPKDIVAGDFYWFHYLEKQNLFFIAAADCTGHGVPGAFTSVVCSEKLSYAVKESAHCGEILSLVNLGVKTSLRQSENSETTKDGMDIALLSLNRINLQHVQLNYAGANRPLWIIKKGKDEILEIKSTKKAIGGFTDNNQKYETHEILLEKGDVFYIFTDGYADQDGGIKGKKLMVKNFKQMLLEIKNKPMQEQHQYLEKFAKEWRGNREQLDDILIIGIKV